MSYLTRRIAVVVLPIVLSLSVASCAHEVGSDGWCKKMKDTPKGDWSANEAADYAKHCLFK